MPMILANARVDREHHLKLCAKLKLRKNPRPRTFSAWLREQEAKEVGK